MCLYAKVTVSVHPLHASACLLQQQLHTYGLPVYTQAASARMYVIPVKGT